MAIVVRSKKNLDYILNPTGTIGPGNYNLLEKSYNEYENFAPFNSSEKKLAKNNKENPNVGPGYYQKSFSNENFFHKKNFHTKNNDKSWTKMNFLMAQLIDKKKEKNEEEKQKKIKIDLHQKYSISNLKRNNNKNKKIVIINTTKTLNRVNSIPSKLNCFGYNINENGDVYINENPNGENYYTGEKDNSVGPDYYYKTNNKLNAHFVDWSKMSTKEIIDFKNNNNNNDKSVNNSSFMNNYLNTTETTLNNKILPKSNSTNDIKLLNKNKKEKLYIGFISRKNNNNESKEKILENNLYNNLFNFDPGPGYYNKDNIFENIKRKANNYYEKNHQCFGVSSKRNLSTFTKELNDIGPGHYSPDLFEKKEKFVPNFFPFAHRENIIKKQDLFKKSILYNTINNNIGPGKYEIKSQFDMEKNLNKISFSYEKRFNDYINGKSELYPGPGEYLKLKKWDKPEKKIIKVSDLIQNNINNINKNLNLNKNEEINIEKRDDKITPGVGMYNPDIINSINYKIKSRENKLQSIIAPFNSGVERFNFQKSSSTSDLIGPGSYNILKNNFNNINNKKIIENKPLEKYINEKNMQKSKLGPGEYYNINYNDWNIKSFNTLFL